MTESISDADLDSDHEEGELVDGLSDISDEEPEVKKSMTATVVDAATFGKFPRSLGQVMHDEDMEEDILFLRLMALKSMAPELDLEEETPDMVDEMEQLLREADQASAEAAQRLAHLANDQDSYSPTQSPFREVIESATDESFDTMDFTSSTDCCLRPTLQEQFGHQHVITSISSDSNACDDARSEDMDLASENEAENQFFRDQIDPEKQKNAPFPPSVWHVSSSAATSIRSPASSCAGGADPFLTVPQLGSDSTGTDDRPVAPAHDEANDDEDEEALRASLLSSLRQKSPPLAKRPPITAKVMSRPTSGNRNNDIVKLNQMAVKLKHFPNLAKSVIVTLNDSSDDDEEDSDERSQGGPCDASTKSVDPMERKIDMFLKQVRSQGSEAKKTTPPPKPVRKYPPVKSGKVKKPPRMTMSTKTFLMTTDVTNLPPAKQAEYKRLKALIAKKEWASQGKGEKLPATAAADTGVQNGATTQDTSGVPQVDGSKKLKASEKLLVSRRQDLISELYKLSTHMSQIKEEQKLKKSAVNEVTALRQQLLEAEANLLKRQQRVHKLHSLANQSSSRLIQLQKSVVLIENHCRILGNKLLGSQYSPPDNGRHSIDAKLEVIVNEAKRGQAKDQSVVQINPSLAHLLPEQQGSHRFIDPFRELCPFELQGKCNDDLCSLQHHSAIRHTAH